jgi:peptidoglycan/xylan/chitin deacetylase (PgdA/CDA1 family)
MIGDVAKTLGQRAAGQISGALSLLGDRAGNAPGILCYHRIADITAGTAQPTINVTPARFKRQLAGLQRLGYQFWPLTQLLAAARKREPLPPRVIVVTFDDGYECVHSAAWPILQELNVPATIFVNTAYLDSAAPFPFDRWGIDAQNVAPISAWRPLTIAQCQEMIASGLIEIGAHTHTHSDFRGRSGELESDLQQCCASLKESFGLGEISFAFPFGRRDLGYVSDELMAAARRAGVTCALTTECELVDPSSDPFGWGRFNVYDWDSAATIAARLRGWYGWAPKCQRQLRNWKQQLFRRQEIA